MTIFRCSNVVKRFGGLFAVNGVDLSIEAGSIHGLIGPNGSGKTTLFNMISGQIETSGGTIEFLGLPIHKMKAHSIAQLGMARTFQHIELFKGASVLDNVRIGAQCKLPPRLFEIILRTNRVRAEDESRLSRAMELLDFVGLLHLKDEQAGNLSYGNQRLVEIGRALATQPKLLLLDEPAAGMNITEKQDLVRLIKKINETGTTIIIVEHDIRLVAQVAQDITVLDAGKKISEGSPQVVQNDPAVIQAYLGDQKMGGAQERASSNVVSDSRETLLSVDGLNTYYGHVQALTDVSFSIAKGEYVALIGANGAGKTTLLKTISGIVQPQDGDIKYSDRSIVGRSPDSIVGLGIVQVPEGRGIFPGLNVVENLRMGAYLRSDKSGINCDIEQMFDLFPRLRERAKQLGGSLSGGEQQMLAISRAVMSQPNLLLLDEPSMGLAPILADEVLEKTRALYEMGITILLVEQNAKAALDVADRAIVLEVGKVALQGNAQELAQNDSVRRAYLGVS